MCLILNKSINFWYAIKRKTWNLFIIEESVISTEKALPTEAPTKKELRDVLTLREGFVHLSLAHWCKTSEFPATIMTSARGKAETYPCWKKAKLTQMGMWWMLNGTGSRSSGVYCVKTEASATRH